MTNPSTRWMIYGAYGYTGDALARAAAEAGEDVVLAGRRADPTRKLAEELDLDHRAFGLDDPDALQAGLEGVALVAHCAGPFSRTAAPMREACLAAGVHYLDITGEIDVFVASHETHSRAVEAGAVIMSGTGFDVIPSDCLALHLKQRLPTATRLELAFRSSGGISPGTSKTMLDGGGGGKVRQSGEIVSVPTAWKTRTVPFPDGPRHATSIPWGDVATAFYSTEIPNIVVYMDMAKSATWILRLGRPLEGLLRWGPISRGLEGWIDRSVQGPSPAARARGKSQLWGRVEDDAGGYAEATLVTPEGYRLTVLGTLAIARRVLAGGVEPGAWTPAQAFGPDFILEFPDTARKDLA